MANVVRRFAFLSHPSEKTALPIFSYTPNLCVSVPSKRKVFNKKMHKQKKVMGQIPTTSRL